MAYFRKRNEKWSFTIDIGIDENGKRKQKTLSGFNTKKEAQVACAELVNKVSRGEYIEQTNKTLREFMNEWMDLQIKQTVRISTYENYYRAINKRILPVLGHLKLKEITPAHIQRFYKELVEEGLTAEYIRYLHSLLKNALRFAVKWQLIAKNMVDLVDPPRINRKEKDTWTMEQSNRLLGEAKNSNPNYYILYFLAVYTGMRRGELLGLQWKDIDFNEGKISVSRTSVVVNGGNYLFHEPKTSSSNRLISIPEIVLNELRRHQLQQRKQKLYVGKAYEDWDLVAATELGKPIHPKSLTDHFHRMIKKADIPKIRFHDLRHTHATLLLKLGEHPKIVSERLGHHNIHMTLNTYSHVMPDMQKATADNFAKAMDRVSEL
ncbi:tyrosine-type recombinase/integrase [Brevibacillus reuszeri]|uniref:site-specific integrase n=1 Tax=Brevibacillus reuszeri TaxID=54915 RepID=UPI003D1B8517